MRALQGFSQRVAREPVKLERSRGSTIVLRKSNVKKKSQKVPLCQIRLSKIFKSNERSLARKIKFKQNEERKKTDTVLDQL